MSKNKLNNILSFKEHTSLGRLENKPGKILERFESYNEGIFWDNKEEKIAKAEKEILSHPYRSKFYKTIKGTDKGDKYLKFFMKGGKYPKWDNIKNDFVETGKMIDFVNK